MEFIAAHQEKLNVLYRTFSLDLPGGINVQPSYLQAGAIVGLLFFLVLMLGRLRSRINHWTIKGALPGISFGFAIAIILEGLLLVGGKTVLTEVLSWKNPPKPISNVLDTGRSRLVQVLGVKDSTDVSSKTVSAETVVLEYKALTPKEASSVKQIICSQ